MSRPRPLRPVQTVGAHDKKEWRRPDGRDYYQKKLAEGKTSKEAIRALKRRISDVVYRRLEADARRPIN